MKNSPSFRSYEPDQALLLPPCLQDWLPEDHLAYFVREVVESLDLGPIYAAYAGRRGGAPPYHPQMMVSLLVYAYCVGLPSSRRIEQATHESVPFRILAAGAHPDHDTIAEFRRRHLEALAGLFVQALRLCEKAGLVRLGHIALDGTKMRANASKHKAMSYARMLEKEAQLKAEVAALLAEAERIDAQEDALYGQGKRREELPEELRFKKGRLQKIREARRALEAEAEAAAQEQAAAQGQDPPPPAATKPSPKAQRNFTDPDSRIMKSGSKNTFDQCYNCQAAVDADSQIIVAAAVTQAPNDKQQLKPMLAAVKKNLRGRKPAQLSADNGYYSEDNIKTLARRRIEAFVHPGALKDDHRELPSRGPMPRDATLKEILTRTLRTRRGAALYSKRKETVEPVFGQVKQARGIRQFLLRGLEKVDGEWSLICWTHNVLKLHRSGWRPAPT